MTDLPSSPRPLRVAIASLIGPPEDPGVWSGISAQLVSELRQRDDVELVLVGPVGGRAHRLVYSVGSVTRRTPMGRLAWETEAAFMRFLGRDLRRRLDGAPPVDAVITLGWAPAPTDGLPPVLFWGDATNAQRVDIAPHWSGLARRSRANVEPVEGDILRGVDAVVMASRWAADDVTARYGVPADRVHVVPFGSNLPATPPIERPPRPEVIRLLSIGLHWERKGLDVAVASAVELAKRGHQVRLDLVGATPPKGLRLPPIVATHGRIARDAAGTARIADLYREAHVFVLPSRHDPFPVVLAEAAAFSVPVVAPDIDGIPERVDHDASGLLLPSGASPSDYADAVEAIVLHPETYERMQRAAHRLSVERFPWPRTVGQLLEVAGAVADRGPAPPA